MLDIDIARHPAAVVWRLTGDLTVQTTDLLRAALARLTDPVVVRLDLSGLRSADRAGVAALVALFLRAREVGATVEVAGVAAPVVRVLRSEGLARLAEMTARGGQLRPRPESVPA